MATSGTAPSNLAKASQQPVTAREIVGIHVKFTLNTPEGLRRVTFELRKTVENDIEKWTIGFQLFERARKTDPFGDPLVDLNVDVDVDKNDEAEAMADDGMNKKQARFALGKAADTAKNPAVDTAKKKATVQKTLDDNPTA
jgi:hypothetical protein